MKLPNGFGSVEKLSGNRRKPWGARILLGYDEDGKRQRKYIGYAKTKEEALKLLSEYNNDPWDIEMADKTFKDVFNLWKENNEMASTTVRSYTSKFKNYCKSLYDIPYKDLRTYHFKTVLHECDKSAGTKNIILKLFRVLDKTAIEYEIIKKSYSEGIKKFDEGMSDRKIFTDEEINTLWNNLDLPGIDIVLIFLYTGLRREELATLKVKDIDLENWTLRGGSKTKAGKDRLIPIHSKIRGFIKERVKESDGETLFNVTGKALYESFKKVMKALDMKHIPHECRHTVETCLDNKGANRKCIDLIMGHTSGGTGQRVYNHKTVNQLRETIELLY